MSSVKLCGLRHLGDIRFEIRVGGQAIQRHAGADPAGSCNCSCMDPLGEEFGKNSLKTHF